MQLCSSANINLGHATEIKTAFCERDKSGLHLSFLREHRHRWTSKSWTEMKRRGSSWSSTSSLLPILSFLLTSCWAESARADHTQQIVDRVGLYTHIKDNRLKTWQRFIHRHYIHSLTHNPQLQPQTWAWTSFNSFIPKGISRRMGYPHSIISPGPVHQSPKAETL